MAPGFTVENPLPWFRESYAQLAFDLRAGETKPIDLCTAGPVPNTLAFPTARAFTLGIKSTSDASTIWINHRISPFDEGIRYLPWQPDRCTYVRLDADAKIIFTGPLSGCNVYVAGPKTSPVLFHANSNANQDSAAANNSAKRQLALDLLAASVLGPGAAVIGGSLERAAYAKDFLGFVFGFPSGGDWQFWFHGIAGGKTTKLSRFF